MSTAPEASAALSDWLHYIDQVHPRQIELGLERAKQVLQRLQLGAIAPLIVTVAGTNGKGSCVAGIALALQHSGMKTGVYTSPHIVDFNERIVINDKPVSDRALCSALAAVDRCRGEISLTYFEFATLAAFKLFHDAGLDAVVLEVGLGGRLDAVNLLDPTLAVISSIALDHTNWLGNDREAIGFEKAGIARVGVPLVCGDHELPASIVNYATELGAPLYRLGVEFDLKRDEQSKQWQFRGRTAAGEGVQLASVEPGQQIVDNLATILQALTLLSRRLDPALLTALATLQLPGRFEQRQGPGGVRVLFDVAHNPAGARCLAGRLAATRRQNPEIKRVVAVFAVMADKEVDAMADALQTGVDIWYIAQVDEPRCLPAHEVAQRFRKQGEVPMQLFDSVPTAFQTACTKATGADLVLVTGSFHTVGAVRHLTEAPVTRFTVNAS